MKDTLTTLILSITVMLVIVTMIKQNKPELQTKYLAIEIINGEFVKAHGSYPTEQIAKNVLNKICNRGEWRKTMYSMDKIINSHNLKGTKIVIHYCIVEVVE